VWEVQLLSCVGGTTTLLCGRYNYSLVWEVQLLSCVGGLTELNALEIHKYLFNSSLDEVSLIGEVIFRVHINELLPDYLHRDFL